MITKTVHIGRKDGMTKDINAYEEDGWAVRTMVANTNANGVTHGVFVVFEKRAEE